MTSGTRPDPLARDHHIPLRRQLAAGLEAAIRDRHVPPGSPLPSTRDLAARLGVHRSTVSAAYARLRRRGHIASAPGRRTVARTPVASSRADGSSCLCAGGAGARPGPGDLARQVLAGALRRALEQEVPREALLGALFDRVARLTPGPEEPRRDDPCLGVPPRSFAPGPAPLVLVEPRPGLARALRAELEARLGRPVPAVRSPRKLPVDAIALVRRELLDRLPEEGALDRVPLDLSGGTRERGIVRRSVRRGLVVLFSASASVRAYASELAAREFSRGVSFLAVDPADAREAVHATAAARLVLSDRAVLACVPATRAPVVTIQLLANDRVAALRAYLGPIRARPRG